MIYTIYRITCVLNGKAYIGKHATSNIDDGYMGSGKLIVSAIKKYGVENFVKEILFIFESEDEMNKKEAELVTEEFCDRIDTYNLRLGGDGGWDHINKNRLGVRIGPKHSAETKTKIGRASKGRLHSDDTKANIGRQSKERNATEAAIEANRGRPRSKETRQKLSVANRKSYVKVETRVVCPHCGKEGFLIGMKRWHFENCGHSVEVTC
jgi:group I intron endonuclease